jgi:DNA-binding response OmpR family regulator
VSRRVLVVDDEPALGSLIARGFRQRGFEVLEVSDGLVALAMVQAASPRVDLVITNTLSRPLTGVELAARLREAHPALPVIHLAGRYHQEGRWYENTPPGGIPTVFQPFNLWDLVAEAEKLLNQPRQPA